MSWLGHDVASRKKGISKLLSLVKLPLLHPSVSLHLVLLTFYNYIYISFVAYMAKTAFLKYFKFLISIYSLAFSLHGKVGLETYFCLECKILF